MAEESTAMRRYWRVCEEDNVTIIVEVHPDAGPDATMLDPDDWEEFGLRCPVCGESETWEGGDPTTTRDDEQNALRRLHLSLADLLDDLVGPACQMHGDVPFDGCASCRAVATVKATRAREAARAR